MTFKKTDQLSGNRKSAKISPRVAACGCFHCTGDKGSLTRASVKRKIISEEMINMRDKDQAWFWTSEWQQGEKEVEQARARGEQGIICYSDEEFLETLDSFSQ